MFFKSDQFRSLEGGVSAAWLQQQLHTQNLSNLETPGYKAKGLVFGQVLDHAQGSAKTIQSKIVTDTTTEIRPDGNNVDFDKESLELYKSYVQYSLLLDKVKGQFNGYNTVLSSNMK